MFRWRHHEVRFQVDIGKGHSAIKLVVADFPIPGDNQPEAG